MGQLHSLLKRQFKKYFNSSDTVTSEDWAVFISRVNETYTQFDVDRRMIEHSLELSSQELLQANADVRAILSAFPDLFFIVNASGQIKQFSFKNSSEIYLAHSVMLGRNIQDVYPSSVGKLFSESVEQVLKNHQLIKVEYVLPFQSVEKYYEARLLPFQEGKVFIVVRDITEGKNAEQELKNAHAQILHNEKLASIGQLAAGVAHEINNPVGFISNNMEILHQYIENYTKVLKMMETLAEYVESSNWGQVSRIVAEFKLLAEDANFVFMKSDVSRLLEHSENGLERIRKIVFDLRTFARDDGEGTVELLAIEEVIDSILSIVHNELKYKAQLIKDYDSSGLVRANATRLGQVFLNLLINSVQAIKEKGQIIVKTYQDDNFVCVDIVDTGQGILPEHIVKVFDPFFTTKPVGQGTGLGLSVSYEIIQKFGGMIKVRSTRGVGTTFTVMLPISGSVK